MIIRTNGLPITDLPPQLIEELLLDRLCLGDTKNFSEKDWDKIIARLKKDFKDVRDKNLITEHLAYLHKRVLGIEINIGRSCWTPKPAKSIEKVKEQVLSRLRRAGLNPLIEGQMVGLANSVHSPMRKLITIIEDDISSRAITTKEDLKYCLNIKIDKLSQPQGLNYKQWYGFTQELKGLVDDISFEDKTFAAYKQAVLDAFANKMKVPSRRDYIAGLPHKKIISETLEDVRSNNAISNEKLGADYQALSDVISKLSKKYKEVGGLFEHISNQGEVSSEGIIDLKSELRAARWEFEKAIQKYRKTVGSDLNSNHNNAIKNLDADCLTLINEVILLEETLGQLLASDTNQGDTRKARKVGDQAYYNPSARQWKKEELPVQSSGVSFFRNFFTY